MSDDASFTMLTKLLDAAAVRQKLIAHNLANANTPGYRRRVVSFEEELAQAVASRDTERLRGLRFRGRESDDPAVRPDGNSVTPEREFADLMRNTLMFQTAAQLLSSRIAAYRAAITGDAPQ